jgi:hypothetical protein
LGAALVVAACLIYPVAKRLGLTADSLNERP